jgi:Polyketide cyclase / dehydrase and lipid transport
MDDNASLDYPLAVVFGYLATPHHLGDWLPQAVEADDGQGPVDVGRAFSFRLCSGSAERQAQGELIAYEPPFSVAYRLFVGPRAHVVRVTCTNAGPTTRVHVHQPDDPRPLLVDLARLGRALQATAGGPLPQPASKGKEPPA